MDPAVSIISAGAVEEPADGYARAVADLLDQPHRRATTLLSSGAPVYLLVNPVEYHGPHLSLHNDGLLSRALVAQLHERFQRDHDWPLLQAADLELGFEPVSGPGSRHSSFATVRDQVRPVLD